MFYLSYGIWEVKEKKDLHKTSATFHWR